MKLEIYKGKADGIVTAPPSKSMAHRFLICGALSSGSEIHNIAFSKDIEATIECLKNLGANIEICGTTVKCGGLNINKLQNNKMFCNESGSTLRFMIPLCLLFGKDITLNGSERLFSRSLEVYENIAEEQGLYFKCDKNSVVVNGVLKSGEYRVRGDISSQFISGLMFALPLLKGHSIIKIEGNIESKPYIMLTLKALKDFGIDIKFFDNEIYIKGNQKYNGGIFTVEGDYSNAAFLDAFNIIGGNVEVNGLCPESEQGDRIYKEYFSELENGSPTLDISDCPDLGPILIALAAAKNGAIFTGTKRLEIKESDRGNAMKEELAKFGCSITVEDNRILVPKSVLKAPTKEIYGHNDHRIVMAMAVLLTLTGGIIDGVEAVSKSYPDFFNILSTLGVSTKEL